MTDDFATVDVHAIETGDMLAGVPGHKVAWDVVWHALEYPDGHGRWLVRDAELNVIAIHRLGARVQVVRDGTT